MSITRSISSDETSRTTAYKTRYDYIYVIQPYRNYSLRHTLMAVLMLHDIYTYR